MSNELNMSSHIFFAAKCVLSFLEMKVSSVEIGLNPPKSFWVVVVSVGEHVSPKVSIIDGSQVMNGCTQIEFRIGIPQQ